MIEIYFPEVKKPLLLDVDDFPLYQQKRWKVVKGDEKTRRMNRVVEQNGIEFITLTRFLLKPNFNRVVDHINGNSMDNRRCNLRICTISQNTANQRKQRGCSSKYRGVSFAKGCKKRPWQSYIQKDGKTVSIGYFKSEVEAAEAYNKKALELFGEFARLNNIERGVV